MFASRRVKNRCTVFSLTSNKFPLRLKFWYNRSIIQLKVSVYIFRTPPFLTSLKGVTIVNLSVTCSIDLSYLNVTSDDKIFLHYFYERRSQKVLERLSIEWYWTPILKDEVRSSTTILSVTYRRNRFFEKLEDDQSYPLFIVIIIIK